MRGIRANITRKYNKYVNILSRLCYTLYTEKSEVRNALSSRNRKNYVFIAQNKTSYKWYKTLILAVFAGIFIAVASMLATVAGSGYDGVKAILIKAAVFPVGLILITLSGSELLPATVCSLLPRLAAT